MKKHFTLAFILLNTFILAQTNFYRIVGQVKKNGALPVEYGNVIALNIKDSALIKGAPFENGRFDLGPLNSDSILLKITSVGYSDLYQVILRNTKDSILMIGDVLLVEGKSLNEVTVSAKTPLFESDGEKIKVNVEGTALNNAGNALDVLKRSPGIQVSTSDVVSVFGKGTAIIYLDGVVIPTVDVLKSLPSSDIKKIEIINNPSAKYDAGGRAVINIITIRNNLQGYNGNIIQNTLYIKSVFSYSGLRFNYTKKK